MRYAIHRRDPQVCEDRGIARVNLVCGLADTGDLIVTLPEERGRHRSPPTAHK
jgi:hypothetical protein